MPQVSNWSASADEFSLVFESNPLAEFVEFPTGEPKRDLRYSQSICGAIRGALEMVSHVGNFYLHLPNSVSV